MLIRRKPAHHANEQSHRREATHQPQRNAEPPPGAGGFRRHRPRRLASRQRVRQRALHGRDEVLQPVFGNVVVCAALDQLDGDLGGHHAGDEDEGKVEAALFERLEGLGSTEAREDVVGDDDVPAPGPRSFAVAEFIGGGGDQGGTHLLFGFDARERHFIAALFQGVPYQKRIVFGVFDKQDA